MSCLLELALNLALALTWYNRSAATLPLGPKF